MTIKYLKNAVDNVNDFYFTYDGARAGVELSIKNRVRSFHLWWKDVDKTYSEWNDVIHDPVFSGNSIATLLSRKQIEIEFS